MSGAVALNASHSNALARWLRFDRNLDVEAAYRRFVNASKFGWFVAAAVVLGVAFDALFSAIIPQEKLHAGLLVGMLVLYTVPPISLQRVRSKTLLRMLRGRIDLLRGVIFGVLASVATVVCTILAVLLMERAGFEAPAQQPLPGGMLGAFVLLVFLAPVAEEFAIQGWLQTRLLVWGVPASVIGTTVIFASLHGPTGVIGFVQLCGLLGLALMRAWSGSLAACIAMHAANNSLYSFVNVLYTVQPHLGHPGGS